jgi:hypothetical protein
MDPTMQTCSLCGVSVSDLASHIVDDHTELQDMERYGVIRSEYLGDYFLVAQLLLVSWLGVNLAKI